MTCQVPVICASCQNAGLGKDAGMLKPDIVFFGESLPAKFHQSHSEDLENCDLVMVMGTSLRGRNFFSEFFRNCFMELT